MYIYIYIYVYIYILSVPPLPSRLTRHLEAPTYSAPA